MKNATLAFLLLAFTMIASAAQSDHAEAKNLRDTTAEHLKSCHKIHKFVLESVDRLPYQSPLDVMKKFEDPKHISESCSESANSIIEPWKSMNDADRKQQENGWSSKLGFSFDEVIEDYNFFNWIAANTKDTNAE